MAKQNKIALGGMAAVMAGIELLCLSPAKAQKHAVAESPYRIAGIWESTASNEGSREEFSLTPSEDIPEDIDGRLTAEATSGILLSGQDTYLCGSTVSAWQISGTDLTFFCGDKPPHKFTVTGINPDIILTDTATGRLFTRKSAIKFSYKEKGQNKRLTLYESPGDTCHACSGYIWGVFEEAGLTGKFNATTVTQPFSVIGSFGRASTSDVIAKDLDSWQKSNTSLLAIIGKNKLAIVFPGGGMHQGHISQGAWLLEYSGNQLVYRGYFALHEDNSGTECSTSLKTRNSETGAEPCVSYDGIFLIGNSSVDSDSDYYDITIRNSGTTYDFDTEKIIPVKNTNLYTFDKNSAKYIRHEPPDISINPQSATKQAGK